MVGVHHEAGSIADAFPAAEVNRGLPSPDPGVAAETAFLLGIIDRLPDYISVRDSTGRVLFANRAHTELLGAASRQEVLGKTDRDFLPPALAEQYSVGDQAVLRSGKPLLRHQEPAQDRAGRARWLSTTRIPLTDDAGTIRAILRVSQDVTERNQTEVPLRQIEALYHTLIEGLPQRVFFKDTQSAFVSVNAVFARDLNLRPEDLIGKTDFDLFPKELAEKYRADDQRVMQRRQPEILEETNISEGTQRIVEVVKVPVIGTEGNLFGLLGIFTDITDRKRAEKKLKAFAAQLQRSNRELQDFASVASHDLQEPLRKVAVFGSRLQAQCREAVGPDGQDYLARMLKATERMQTFINDLLAFARVTTQAQPFVPVNLGAVAKEVVADLEARLEQVGGRVDLGGLPTIDADPLQMRQLFQNLIGNALKFRRPCAAPVVTLRGEIVAREKEGAGPGDLAPDMCRITVADNGIGFEDKYAERIFQVFQRLNNRSQYEGSGMGLAICRKIAERHGGAITAHGTPGQGATFIVRLPVTRPQEAHAYDQ